MNIVTTKWVDGEWIAEKHNIDFLKLFNLFCARDNDILNQALHIIAKDIPNAFIWENIENNLHYTEYLPLVDALYRMAVEENKTIIASTQSKEFIIEAHEYFKGMSDYPFQYTRFDLIEGYNQEADKICQNYNWQELEEALKTGSI